MQENVSLATEGQLDELRIALERAFNGKRGHLPKFAAQGWIANSAALGALLESLLPRESRRDLYHGREGLYPYRESIELPHISSFSVANKFVQKIPETAQYLDIQIADMGNNFSKHLRYGEEAHIMQARVSAYTLNKNMIHPAIIVGLQFRHTMPLAHIWHMLSGKDGGLLQKDGGHNYFYHSRVPPWTNSTPPTHVHWIIQAIWEKQDEGWHLEAYPVESDSGTYDVVRIGARIISY